MAAAMAIIAIMGLAVDIFRLIIEYKRYRRTAAQTHKRLHRTRLLITRTTSIQMRRRFNLRSQMKKRRKR